jgi:hypothetical protein
MMSKPNRWMALGLMFATSALSVGACAPSGAYVEVDYPPRNIVAYPYVIYEGRSTYYVDGHWYYRDGARWAYYRDPPARLREYHEPRAPRAYPEPRHDYERVRHEEARRREFEHARHDDARRQEHKEHEGERPGHPRDSHADARAIQNTRGVTWRRLPPRTMCADA